MSRLESTLAVAQAPHQRPVRAAGRPSLVTRWARHAEDVQAAQRLRHAVFAGEMGAQLRPPPDTPPGLDVDRFDAHCEPLIVLRPEDDDGPAEVTALIAC